MQRLSAAKGGVFASAILFNCQSRHVTIRQQRLRSRDETAAIILQIANAAAIGRLRMMKGCPERVWRNICLAISVSLDFDGMPVACAADTQFDEGHDDEHVVITIF